VAAHELEVLVRLGPLAGHAVELVAQVLGGALTARPATVVERLAPVERSYGV
jgi:hypothetical protein